MSGDGDSVVSTGSRADVSTLDVFFEEEYQAINQKITELLGSLTYETSFEKEDDKISLSYRSCYKNDTLKLFLESNNIDFKYTESAGMGNIFFKYQAFLSCCKSETPAKKFGPSKKQTEMEEGSSR